MNLIRRKQAITAIKRLYNKSSLTTKEINYVASYLKAIDSDSYEPFYNLIDDHERITGHLVQYVMENDYTRENYDQFYFLVHGYGDGDEFDFSKIFKCFSPCFLLDISIHGLVCEKIQRVTVPEVENVFKVYYTSNTFMIRLSGSVIIKAQISKEADLGILADLSIGVIVKDTSSFGCHLECLKSHPIPIMASPTSVDCDKLKRYDKYIFKLPRGKEKEERNRRLNKERLKRFNWRLIVPKKRRNRTRRASFLYKSKRLRSRLLRQLQILLMMETSLDPMILDSVSTQLFCHNSLDYDLNVIPFQSYGYDFLSIPCLESWTHVIQN